MNIIFNINLEDYFETKQRDYLAFTTIELSNNLLNGQVNFHRVIETSKGEIKRQFS